MLPGLGESVEVHPFLTVPAVPPSEMRTRLAREILASVNADKMGVLMLTKTGRFECEHASGDIVEVNLHPAVPTHPAHPIAACEPMLFFLPDDSLKSPEVYALRVDFPNVPHLNLLPWAHPRSLCLFNRPYEEYRTRLSGHSLLQRTLKWLALTARGELHAEDQPLEPLIMRAGHDLILPTLNQQALLNQPLSGYPKARNPDLFTIMPPRPGEAGRVTCTVLPIETLPMVHGVIRRDPRTLGDLQTMLQQESGFDLSAALIQAVSPLRGDDHRGIWDNSLILVLILPKIRKEGDKSSGREILAYLLGDTTIKSFGRALDLWYEQETGLGVVLRPDPNNRTDDRIPLLSMQVRFPLTRRDRAAYNGDTPNEQKLVAVGAGALGSQVLSHLIRAGHGQWVVVDDDDLMPHNLARHAVFGEPYGQNKADLMAAYANGTFKDATVRGLYGNVLTPPPAVSQALEEAEVIFDFAASAAVSQHLCFQPFGARRVCAFLNPSGTDLVFLAESSDRQVRLDDLEHQFYQALVDLSALEGHFENLPPYQRYGGGCRDVSLVLSQDQMALHAATASRMVKEVLRDTSAVAALFRTDRRGELRRFDLPTRPFAQMEVNGWQLTINPEVIVQARLLRDESLCQSPPVETGGTLIGAVNLEDRRLAVTGLLPAPPDSRHYPAAFERGAWELRELYERIEARTGGALSYLGEWHSHPRGASASPSADDRKLFAWLETLLKSEGIPPVMLIVADTEVRWLVEHIEEEQHGPE